MEMSAMNRNTSCKANITEKVEVLSLSKSLIPEIWSATMHFTGQVTGQVTPQVTPQVAEQINTNNRIFGIL